MKKMVLLVIGLTVSIWCGATDKPAPEQQLEAVA